MLVAPDEDYGQPFCPDSGFDLLQHPMVVKSRTTLSHPSFHAAFQKIAFQRECHELAAAYAAQRNWDDFWILYLDSDIALPADFRNICEQQLAQLSKEKLYGARGRRNSVKVHEFWALANAGHWANEGAEFSRKTMGYFHLFHSSVARLFDELQSGEKIHDDERIRLAFGPNGSGVFPVTVLHHAKAVWEWGSRSAVPCEPQNPARPARSFHSFWSSACFTSHSKHALLVVGEPSGIDRSFLDAWPHAIAYCDESVLAPAIKDFHPSQIYVTGEPSPRRLLQLVPAILEILGSVTLLGSAYGYPHFPTATAAVELTVGSPDYSDDSGLWAKRIFRTPKKSAFDFSFPIQHHPLRLEDVSGSPTGLIIYVTSPRQQEEAISTLLACRTRWAGPIAIVCWRANLPVLRIVSAHLQAAYLIAGRTGLGDEFQESDPPESISSEDLETSTLFEGIQGCPFCVESCSWLIWASQSPFQKTLLVHPAAQIHRLSVPEMLSEDLDFVAESNELGMEALTFQRSSTRVAELRSALVSLLETKPPGTATWCRLAAASGSVAAPRAAPSSAESHRVLALPHIIVRAPKPLAVCFHSDVLSHAEMLHSQSSLQWKNIPQLMVVGQEAWHGTVGASFSPLGESDLHLRTALPGMFYPLWLAARQFSTEWIAILDGLLKPLPGASFPSSLESDCAIICPAMTRRLRGRDIVSTCRLDTPGFLIKREWACAVLADFLTETRAASPEAESNPGDFLYQRVVQDQATIRVENLLDYGWKF